MAAKGHHSCSMEIERPSHPFDGIQIDIFGFGFHGCFFPYFLHLFSLKRGVKGGDCFSNFGKWPKYVKITTKMFRGSSTKKLKK
jgi:hypothetical protein